jgi:hypothetical protein
MRTPKIIEIFRLTGRQKLVARISQAQKYQEDWQEILGTIFNSAGTSAINLKRVLVSAGPANNKQKYINYFTIYFSLNIYY